MSVSSVLKKFGSLKVTIFLMVAFLLLLFWGVIAQSVAGDTSGGDRFFNNYFVWALDFVPIPAFKSLALVSSLHLIAAMMFRIPRGVRSLGLYLMHAGLFILLAGSLIGSAVKTEYFGFKKVDSSEEQIQFYEMNDSLGQNPIRISEESAFYFVRAKGRVDMTENTSVEIYSAEYDPLHFIPYAFMFLFGLGVILHYPLKVRKLHLLPLCAVMLFAPKGYSAEIDGVSLNATQFLPETPVLYDGQVKPFDSFARDLLDGFMGKVSYKCADNDGTLCDGKVPAWKVVNAIMQNSKTTADWKLFKVNRSDVMAVLGLPGENRYVSYDMLAPAMGKMEFYASRDDGHAATAEMKRLFSNVRMYEVLAGKYKGTLFETLPDTLFHTSIVTKFTPNKIKAEIFYHRMNFALVAFIISLLGSILALFNLSIKSKKLDVGSNVLAMTSASILTLVFIFRFYITAQPPLTNLYEIILLVALMLDLFLAGAFFFCKNRTFGVIAPVSIMATGLLFFAKFGLETGDTFQKIPAVLNSSIFLTIHVFTIALGYCGMILSGIVAHILLIRSSENMGETPLYSLLYKTLSFGSIMTIVGTLLGGVWADFAWGRFWGFDPKECGALFVILWSMILLHLLMGHYVKPRIFALLNSFNVIIIFLCWFGINLLGIGLHSYGFQNGTLVGLIAFIVVDLLLISALYGMKKEGKKIS